MEKERRNSPRDRGDLNSRACWVLRQMFRVSSIAVSMNSLLRYVSSLLWADASDLPIHYSTRRFLFCALAATYTNRDITFSSLPIPTIRLENPYAIQSSSTPQRLRGMLQML